MNAEVDSGLDGRSSDFQLPIHSIELGGGATASESHGVRMAPEYSGIWRMDAYYSPDGESDTGRVGATRFTGRFRAFVS